MAKFLTTIELSYYILQIIKSAVNEIILVTPYLKLSENLKDNLLDADTKGVEITLVYGKSELDKEEKQFLNTLENLNIYYQENLHGKCYFNESMMLITSMNLHEFSEKRNKEFGIIIDSQEDYDLYVDALEEIRLLLTGSAWQKKSKLSTKGFVSFVLKKPELQQFCDFLNTAYGEKKFSILKSQDPFIGRNVRLVSQDFIKNITIEVGRNIDFNLNVQQNICERIFNSSQILSHPELTSQYRVYWNPPYNVIKVYSSIEYRDKWQILDNTLKFNYYKKAIDLMILEIEQDFQNLIHKK
jgi:hypothetical protein